MLMKQAEEECLKTGANIFQKVKCASDESLPEAIISMFLQSLKHLKDTTAVPNRI